LDWLEAVLYAIVRLHENGEAESITVRHLASLGRYVAILYGGMLTSEHDQLAGGQS